MNTTDDEIPQVLELSEYRRVNTDLADLDDDELAAHYFNIGVHEGRSGNHLVDRDQFAALAQGSRVLEIGPFTSPLSQYPRVEFADILSSDGLRERALMHGLDPSTVPEILWVVEPHDLSIIDRKYESILSSHVVEHQPDFVSHLDQVSKLLVPGGKYFVLVPDHRYCFDHFQAPSTIAEILAARLEGRVRHSLRSVLEHRILTTHNDPTRHWNNDHGAHLVDLEARFTQAAQEWEASGESGIDVHAWYFTPASWEALLGMLKSLDWVDFEICRTYPTRRDSNEFWSVLQKSG